MNPLILSISSFALLAAVFLLSRIWLSRQPDSLAARHQALGYLIYLIAATMIVLAVVAYSIPSFTMPRPLGVCFTFMLLYAIWHRRVLTQQLQQRRAS